MAKQPTETGTQVEQPRQAVRVIPSASPTKSGPRPSYSEPAKLTKPKGSGVIASSLVKQ